MRQTLLLLLLLTLAASCARKIAPTVVTPVVAKAPPRDVAVEEIDFEYLHGRAQLRLQDEKRDVEVKAHIRVRKDSVIWMTFSVLGVQGGKALINHDSITIINTVQKEYYVFEYAALASRFGFPVTYNVIQAAMLGNLLQKKSNTDEVTDDGTFDFIRQQTGNLVIMSSVNRANHKVEKVELRQADTSNQLDLLYSNFQPLGEKQFPYQGQVNIGYKVTGSAQTANTRISFEYVKAEVGDRQLNFPFNIPKRYDRR